MSKQTSLLSIVRLFQNSSAKVKTSIDLLSISDLSNIQ